MASGLENLKLDKWYMVLIAGGLAALVTSIAASNNTFAVLALGVFFIGIGEWKNHPERTAIVDQSHGFPALGKLTITTRQASVLGWAFNLIGIACLSIGLYRLLFF
jgi:hypothetical protein